MYDVSFDHSRWSWMIRLAAIAAVVLAASVGAQMPGMPVLQNAWASPGLVAALDVGGGSGGTAYAGAIGWTPGSGRFQVSAGFGSRSVTGHGAKAAYGARLALPFGGASSAFGLAAFAGVGGSATDRVGTANVGGADSLASTTQIPLGAAVAWRHAIGSNHGVSVYADPSYVLYSGGSKRQGLFRASVGADIGITRSLGATVGIELGGTRPRGFGGPSGTTYGLGVSYAFGKR